jgi:hypothetical protein
VPVKTLPAPEFEMKRNDFPALPGKYYIHNWVWALLGYLVRLS